MSENKSPTEPPAKSPLEEIQGCSGVCITLIVGVLVVWRGAKYAFGDQLARSEVTDAFSWELLWLQWCCGVNLVVVLLAILVGVFVADRKGKASQKPPPHQ